MTTTTNKKDETIEAWWDHSNDTSGAARLVRRCEELMDWDHDKAVEILSKYREVLEMYKDGRDWKVLGMVCREDKEEVVRPIRKMWKVHTAMDESGSEWSMLVGRPSPVLDRDCSGGGGRRHRGYLRGRGEHRGGGHDHRRRRRLHAPLRGGGGGRVAGRRHCRGHGKQQGRCVDDGMEDYDGWDRLDTPPPLRKDFKKVWKALKSHRRAGGMVTVRIRSGDGLHLVHCPEDRRMRCVYKIISQEYDLPMGNFYLRNFNGEVVSQDTPLQEYRREDILTIWSPKDEATAVCEEVHDSNLEDVFVLREEDYEETQAEGNEGLVKPT